MFVFLSLISFSVIPARPIHIVAKGRMASSRLSNTPLHVCVHRLLFTHLPLHGTPGWLPRLGYWDNTAVSLVVQAPPGESDFISFLCLGVGPLGHMVVPF